MGLQVSSRLSKRIRRVNLGRRLVVVVEEVVEVEVVNAAVVVVNQMIVVRIELVGDRGDPVLIEVTICVSGVRSVEIASEVILIKRLMANIREMVVVDAVVESIQGRCSSD